MNVGRYEKEVATSAELVEAVHAHAGHDPLPVRLLTDEVIDQYLNASSGFSYTTRSGYLEDLAATSETGETRGRSAALVQLVYLDAVYGFELTKSSSTTARELVENSYGVTIYADTLSRLGEASQKTRLDLLAAEEMLGGDELGEVYDLSESARDEHETYKRWGEEELLTTSQREEREQLRMFEAGYGENLWSFGAKYYR